MMGPRDTPVAPRQQAGSATDRQLLKQAWRLIEDRNEGIADLLGIQPRRPHDVMSALGSVTPDFESYCRLTNLLMASAQELFHSDSLVHMTSPNERMIRHLFEHAIAAGGAY